MAELQAQASPPSPVADANATPPGVTPAKPRQQTIAEIVQREPLGGRTGRKSLKEAIVAGYRLHKAIVSLEKIIQNHVNSNDEELLFEILTDKLESMKRERDDILWADLPPHQALTVFEHRLLEYVQHEMKKDEAGDATIPWSQPLRNWIDKQRARKRFYETGRYSEQPVTAESCADAILILNGVDFVWQNPHSAKIKTWDERYQALVAFHAEHGHCRVRQETPELGSWVAVLRRNYERFVSGGTRSAMVSEERVEALNKLGFTWKVRFGRPKKGDERFRLRRKSKDGSDTPADEDQDDSKEQASSVSTELQTPRATIRKTWDERYQMLVAFHAEHGHCKVPQVHPELGTWVQIIRRMYERYRSGGMRSEMVSEEHVDALNKLGFVWKVRFGRPKKGDERFRLRRKSKEPTSETPPSPAADEELGNDEEEASSVAAISHIQDHQSTGII